MQVLVRAYRLGDAAPLGVLETHLIVKMVLKLIGAEGESKFILGLVHAAAEETKKVNEGDLVDLGVLIFIEIKRVFRVINLDFTFAEVLELADKESRLGLLLNRLLRWV